MGGATLTGLVLTGTTHTVVGTYSSDSWTFTDSAGNYNNASGTITDAIGAPPVAMQQFKYIPCVGTCRGPYTIDTLFDHQTHTGSTLVLALASWSDTTIASRFLWLSLLSYSTMTSMGVTVRIYAYQNAPVGTDFGPSPSTVYPTPRPIRPLWANTPA